VQCFRGIAAVQSVGLVVVKKQHLLDPEVKPSSRPLTVLLRLSPSLFPVGRFLDFYKILTNPDSKIDGGSRGDLMESAQNLFGDLLA
jgi:hypothetical protein